MHGELSAPHSGTFEKEVLAVDRNPLTKERHVVEY